MRLKMQEHKTARIAQAQQFSASGRLLGELQFSVSARLASGGQGQRGRVEHEAILVWSGSSK
jgi:hypothetical protein